MEVGHWIHGAFRKLVTIASIIKVQRILGNRARVGKYKSRTVIRYLSTRLEISLREDLKRGPIVCGIVRDLHTVLEQTLLSEDKVKGTFGVGTKERLEVKSL